MWKTVCLVVFFIFGPIAVAALLYGLPGSAQKTIFYAWVTATPITDSQMQTAKIQYVKFGAITLVSVAFPVVYLLFFKSFVGHLRGCNLICRNKTSLRQTECDQAG
jgi:hypothetical protein